MKTKLTLLFPLIFFISSCIIEDIPEVKWNDVEYKPNIVTESSNHLAFPDIVNYNNTWYITYRESDNHIKGKFSKINVLKSNDFINWKLCNTFEKAGWDLRDPKFSLNEVKDSLYLHIHTTNEIQTEGLNYGTIRKNYYFNFDKNNNKFDEIYSRELKEEKNYQNYWLWRPYWYDDNLYVSAYRTGTNLFYKYNNTDSEPVIISKLNGDGINETTFRVYNNHLYFLSRRNNDALLGSLTIDMDSIYKIVKSTMVSTEKDILQIGQLGGPNMVIHDSIAYIGGRSRLDGIDRTAIYKYSLINKELELLFTLESYGDNSYPGMFLKGNKIYGVYYTQKKNFDGFEIRSFEISI